MSDSKSAEACSPAARAQIDINLAGAAVDRLPGPISPTGDQPGNQASGDHQDLCLDETTMQGPIPIVPIQSHVATMSMLLRPLEDGPSAARKATSPRSSALSRGNTGLGGGCASIYGCSIRPS